MFFRGDYWVQQPLGPAVPGASVAVLTDPSNFSTQPGTPLATIYAAASSNSANVTAAQWIAEQIIFTLNTVPADVVPGSYIAVSGALAAGYNSTLEAPWLVLGVVGLEVAVQAFTNPGTWVSGGTVATSVLPNPTSTDGNGHAFFYAAAGLYGVQIYGETILEQDYPDQGIGTVSGSGTVTSVGLALPMEFTVSGSPVTSSGTLTGAWANENANTIMAGPSAGPAGTPGFRTLVPTDIPALAYVTSVGFSLAVPGIFTESVAGSPVTSSGTLAATIGLATQSANLVWAGPTSGGPAQPSFRALVAGDIPATGGGIVKIENFNVTPVTVNTTTSETPLMTFTLAANELAAGQTLTVNASGTNAMANASTVTLRLYIDGNVIATAISTSTGSAGPFGWEANGRFMIVSTGAGGTLEVHADFSAALSGATPLYQTALNAATSAIAFDTTATHVIQVTAQPSVNNVGNTTTQRQMLAQRIG